MGLIFRQAKRNEFWSVPTSKSLCTLNKRSVLHNLRSPISSGVRNPSVKWVMARDVNHVQTLAGTFRESIRPRIALCQVGEMKCLAVEGVVSSDACEKSFGNLVGVKERGVNNGDIISVHFLLMNETDTCRLRAALRICVDFIAGDNVKFLLFCCSLLR
ncbi:hypothetical protein TNCT_189911 [Trichonephila clavata]|uniref:Uncharacterized protein n=1 Tax=Trichonephila clavata TaxID=2740835 RepID=A0A8X6L2K9_TRICU|nr:hypothetical protein TNCT_189911 [Trichonephila clavata]